MGKEGGWIIMKRQALQDVVPINMCVRKWRQDLQVVGGGDCSRGGDNGV